jgi:hypothetical protein
MSSSDNNVRLKTKEQLETTPLGDAIYEAMVRHHNKQPIPTTAGGAGEPPRDDDSPDIPKGKPDLAWGADESAIEIFGPPSMDTAENRRRRRRVFAMYEAYRQAVADAKKHKRPLPVNIGWLTLPQCNRIVLSKSAYREFIAAQLEARP